MRRARRVLLTLQAFIAVTAVVGGTILLLRPDGATLGLDPTLLARSPFKDWTWPGFSLVALIGGGFTLAFLTQLWRLSRARLVSVCAAAGLVFFELAEFLLIGFHPLQAVYILLAAWILGLIAAERRAETK